MKNEILLLNDANELIDGLAYKYTELKEVPCIYDLNDFKSAVRNILSNYDETSYSYYVAEIEEGVVINIDNEVILHVNEKFNDLATYFKTWSEY
ncbi:MULTISPECIES: hypothetical protein [Sphingobacterium]|uniref:hypothetical protein n=1 Tax=Sphingobacterium TaxID=28453 RepID=UPI0013DB17EE|nr:MULTISPECIES: hypothetical protein [unclassified Sphingobacterium]